MMTNDSFDSKIVALKAKAKAISDEIYAACSSESIDAPGGGQRLKDAVKAGILFGDEYKKLISEHSGDFEKIREVGDVVLALRASVHKSIADI